MAQRWLPPVYRAPQPPPRLKTPGPARPALRLVTIGLLTVLFTLLVLGVAWALLLP